MTTSSPTTTTSTSTSALQPEPVQHQGSPCSVPVPVQIPAPAHESITAPVPDHDPVTAAHVVSETPKTTATLTTAVTAVTKPNEYVGELETETELMDLTTPTRKNKRTREGEKSPMSRKEIKFTGANYLSDIIF